VSKTTTIGYDDGPFFWVFDVARAIWMKDLIDAAVRRRFDEPPFWMATEIPDWRVTASISDYAWILDDKWSRDQERDFLDVADDACAALSCQPELDAAEVTRWTLVDELPLTTRPIHGPIETGPLVELGRAVIDLVTDQLEPPPDGEVWCFGFPQGRSTIRTDSRFPPVKTRRRAQ
jgi:hypothetical protein